MWTGITIIRLPTPPDFTLALFYRANQFSSIHTLTLLTFTRSTEPEAAQPRPSLVMSSLTGITKSIGSVFKKKTGCPIFITGLDCAGKTTLLDRWKDHLGCVAASDSCSVVRTATVTDAGAGGATVTFHDTRWAGENGGGESYWINMGFLHSC